MLSRVLHLSFGTIHTNFEIAVSVVAKSKVNESKRNNTPKRVVHNRAILGNHPCSNRSPVIMKDWK